MTARRTAHTHIELKTARALSPYKVAQPVLYALGHSAIPLPAGEKGPRFANWQKHCDELCLPNYTLNPADIPRGANVGLCMGVPVGEHRVVAIDIDVDDLDVIDRLRSALPPANMSKCGAKGETWFYLASPEVTSAQYRRADGNVLVDLLAHGKQTVVPPSVHPTGRIYQWLTGPVAATALPILDVDHMIRLHEALEASGWTGAVDTPRDGANGQTIAHDDDDDMPWDEVNSVALATLSAWVPALGLCRCKPKKGGYQAVADWRPSTDGNAIEDRKLNLSIDSRGIVDFGTGQGYTAIDLVMAAKCPSFGDALEWLRDKLGMRDDADDWIDDITVSSRPRVEAQEAGTVTMAKIDGVCCDAETGEVLATLSAVPLLPPMPRNDNRPVADREFPDHLTRVPGLLGDIVEYLVDTAERPNRPLSLGSALTVLGTAIGRRDATPTKSGTHLYIACLTGTGMGKDHIQSAGDLLLQYADDDVDTKLVGGGDFMSRTAVLRELKNPLHVNFIDEFGLFLKEINAKNAPSHKAEIKKVLLEIWGKSFKNYRLPTWANEDSVRVEAPAMSILGCSTPASFYDALVGRDRENGFLNRLLLIPAYEPGALRDPAYDFRDVPPALVQGLQDAYRERRQTTPFNAQPEWRIVPWKDEKAESLYKAFREQCFASENVDFFVRSAETAGRLATIRAVGCDVENPVVSVADIGWGIEFARWSATRMAEESGTLISDNPVSQARARIMSALQAAKGRRVPQSQLLRNLPFSGKQLREHLTDLRESGLIELQKEKPAKGGPDKVTVIAL